MVPNKHNLPSTHFIHIRPSICCRYIHTDVHRYITFWDFLSLQMIAHYGLVQQDARDMAWYITLGHQGQHIAEQVSKSCTCSLCALCISRGLPEIFHVLCVLFPTWVTWSLLAPTSDRSEATKHKHGISSITSPSIAWLDFLPLLPPRDPQRHACSKSLRKGVFRHVWVLDVLNLHHIKLSNGENWKAMDKPNFGLVW